MTPAIDVARLADLLREAARAEIMPRFRNLSEADIREKTSATDLVTEADEAAERFIARECRSLLPDALFVGEEYVLERSVVAVGQSRKVESHWVDTTVRHAASGEPAATVLLHSGVFKASYADYPADRLS